MDYDVKIAVLKTKPRRLRDDQQRDLEKLKKEVEEGRNLGLNVKALEAELQTLLYPEYLILEPQRLSTTAEELWKTRLSQVVQVADFPSSKLPPEVVAKWAEYKEYFHYLEIWSGSNACALIGFAAQPHRHAGHHLLALWTERNKKFPSLKEIKDDLRYQYRVKSAAMPEEEEEHYEKRKNQGKRATIQAALWYSLICIVLPLLAGLLFYLFGKMMRPEFAFGLSIACYVFTTWLFFPPHAKKLLLASYEKKDADLNEVLRLIKNHDKELIDWAAESMDNWVAKS